MFLKFVNQVKSLTIPMKILKILLILLIIITSITLAEGEAPLSVDVSGEFLFTSLDDFNSTNFLIIRNLNYSSNAVITINTTILFELNTTINDANNPNYQNYSNCSNISNISFSWSINKSIKSYSKTFEEVILNNNTISFCAEVFVLNVEDSNLSNNKPCFFNQLFFNQTVSLENFSNTSLNETLNTSVNITNTASNNSTASSWTEKICELVISSNKQIYSEGETVSFKFNAKGESFVNGINYWVEDSRGKIVKNKVETNNDASKSFTPKLERTNELFVIKAEINDCENLSELYLFFVGKDEILAGASSFLRVKEAQFTHSLFSINFEGYRNSTNKKTLYIWIDGVGIKKEKQKFLIEEKDSFFFLNIVFDISYLKKDTLIYLNVEGLDIDFVQNYSHILNKNNTNVTSDSSKSSSTNSEVLEAPSSLKTKNNSFDSIIDSKTNSNLVTGQVVSSKSNSSSSIFNVIIVIIAFIISYFLIRFIAKYVKKRKII